MSVLVLLIFASLAIATVFLMAFIWAVRSGQYEDTSTPSMRVLVEEPSGRGSKNISPNAEPAVPGDMSCGARRVGEPGLQGGRQSGPRRCRPRTLSRRPDDVRNNSNQGTKFPSR